MKGALVIVGCVLSQLYLAGATTPASTTTSTPATAPAASSATIATTRASNIINLTKAPTTHEINEHTVKILACPSSTGLWIKSATWTATFPRAQLDSDNRDPKVFDRTVAVNTICQGLTNCVLKPVAHLERVTDALYHFFGVPFESAEYKLTVTATCESTNNYPTGRREIASIVPTQDLLMGCNEGEVISLSYVRGSGFFETWNYRRNYCNRSFIEEAYAKCQNQRSCTIDKNLYHTDPTCRYEVIDAQYYCRRPFHLSYYDDISTNGNTEYLLTAEEDSEVIVKAPSRQVLTVRSALWEVIGQKKQEDDEESKNSRNRLDLIQFYCEGRSTCTFIPRRTSDGFQELHMGGITAGAEKRFVLKSKFGIVERPTEENKIREVKKVECGRGQQLTMTCESNQALRIVTASWGGEVTTTPAQSSVVFWVEKSENNKKYRYSEVAAYLEKSVFYHHTLTFDPFSTQDISGHQLRKLPFIPGVPENDHKLEVQYTCMDLSQSPSIADLEIQTMKSLTDESDFDQDRSHTKEDVEEYTFTERSQVIIYIDQDAKSTVKVGEFLTMEIPYEAGQFVVKFTTGNVTKNHQISEKCTDAIISGIIVNERWLHLLVNIFNGDKFVTSFEDDFIVNDDKMKLDGKGDIVTATGGVTGMRVLIQTI